MTNLIFRYQQLALTEDLRLLNFQPELRLNDPVVVGIE